MPNQLNWSTGNESFEIQPGKAVSGFSIQSPQPPGPIQYYADGSTGVPASSPSADEADDEPVPNCPDWDFVNPRLQTIVTGLTTGPVNPNTIPVTIRLREERGEHERGAIDPRKPSGKIGVLVLGSKALDPTQIVISSINFGPAEAKPLSWKFVPTGRENIAAGDEHEEWEKHHKEHEPDFDDNPKKQNLFLVFDESALGVRCVLDKALFLKGQTQGGSNIFGGASTRLVGCDTRHPGKRPPGKHEIMDGGD